MMTGHWAGAYAINRSLSGATAQPSPKRNHVRPDAFMCCAEQLADAFADLFRAITIVSRTGSKTKWRTAGLLLC